jgi:hypothetical protein
VISKLGREEERKREYEASIILLAKKVSGKKLFRMTDF